MMHPNSMGQKLLRGFPRHDPIVVLYLVFICILYHILINVNISISLSSVSCSSKLIEPKEGVVGTSDLQQIGQKHR